MINIIFYSKNRPMQLEACMRSLRNHFKEYDLANKTVIMRATDKDFVKGYREVIEDYPEATFVQESNFMLDTEKALQKSTPLTMFVMDDILFKSDFSLSDAPFSMLKGNAQMLAVSLRLHKGIDYCYALDKAVSLPNFVRDVPGEVCVWPYLGCEGDWGYGYSIDANVYNTDYILPLVLNGHYNNPNELEAVLNSPQVRTGVVAQYMTCYPDGAKLINVPANRVQNSFPNRYDKSWDEVELNKKFLDNERISLENVTNLNSNAVHYSLDFKFFRK